MPQSKDKKKYIRELADLLDESNLSEIEIEEEGLRIRVARIAGTATQVLQQPPAAVIPTGPETAVAVPETAPGLHPGALKSPMVGTVYLSPEPGADSFVSVGGSVKEGETVFIVEAMKVMNPITAQKSGTVKEILVADAQPIEFDQVLMIIE